MEVFELPPASSTKLHSILSLPNPSPISITFQPEPESHGIIRFHPVQRTDLQTTATRKENTMASKLRAVPSPQIQKLEAKIVETIEQLMREYLDESSSMPLKDKKTAINKIVRLSSGLQ
jgi:hypothetical protein